MNEKWKQVLEESRNNYLSIVQALSKMQKEFEKIMINSAENSVSYQQEMGNILNNWVEMGHALRKNFKEIFDANLKNTFSSQYSPVNPGCEGGKFLMLTLKTPFLPFL